MISIAAKIFCRKLPVAGHQPFMYTPYHFDPTLPAVKEGV
jgi:hypothetical protein